jgi:hypothetical protein
VELEVAEDGGGEMESEAEVSAASTAAVAEPSEGAAPAAETTPASPAEATPKKAGRQVGAPGHSRQVSLPVSATVIHAPATCACCGQALEPAGFIARTGLYVLEIETDPGAGLRGLQVRHEKHLYGEITCNCGHVNRSEPGRCSTDPLVDRRLDGMASGGTAVGEPAGVLIASDAPVAAANSRISARLAGHRAQHQHD